MEKHRPLVVKTFNAYCQQQNLHFSATAQNALFTKIWLSVQQNWTNAYANYGTTFSEASLVAELVRLACKKWFKNNYNEDIELLHTAAYKVVVKYQSIVQHLVQKQSKKGESLDADLQADLIANIQAQLLQKANSGKLMAQFKGNASFSTYLYKVAYYCMIDEWRKIKRYKAKNLPNVANLQHIPSNVSHSNDDNYTYLIEQHINRYKIIIDMLPPKKLRYFEFAVKIAYKMKLEEKDIRGLYPNCSNDTITAILSLFGGNYHDLAQSKIFVLIGSCLGELEGVSINTASFRVWFQTTLNKVKRTLFKELPNKDKKAMDAYFEFLLYKFYKKQ